MRTLPYREVWNRTLRLLGIDPQNADISSDIRNSLGEHINARVRVCCLSWRWSEWELTEERAFRPVWNADDQYLRVSVTDGKPDEVFYLGTGFVTGGAFGTDFGYYRVAGSAVSDPPVGTLPTDTTYWAKIEPVDTFIAYDQRCKRSIGMVNGIFSSNPRVPTGFNGRGLKFMPSEKGIDVYQPGNPTVFINYKMPVPRFTMTPYVVGKIYTRGDVVFDQTNGECFQALAATTSIPADTFFWRRVPFPEAWASYVCQGAFADSLMEFDQGGGDDAQVKQILYQVADARADFYFQVETDSLRSQGQQLQWNPCCRDHFWNESQPFSGGSVSTLTDACDDELGFVYPSPTLIPGISEQYRPEINSLRTTAPALNALASRTLLPKSLIQILIDEGGVRTRMIFEVVDGQADPLDPNGQVAFLDYDASNNNKHLERRT